MINEAARCLEERIVESADDIDFAMVMGTGFAPCDRLAEMARMKKRFYED
jgi:hypothetical protein